MLPTRLIVAEKLWSQLLLSRGCGGKQELILQAETTGIPLKAAKYDQVSTLVFNGRSPLINPGPQGAVQSLPPPLPKILISLTSLCAALSTCQRLGSQEGWQGLRTSYGRANCSSERMEKDKSAHSIPLLPSAPLCVSFPQLMLETSPRLLVPHGQGSLGRLWVGKRCPRPMAMGLSAAEGLPETGPPAPAPSPSGLQEVTSHHRALLSPSLGR